jgi:hypothetical protein
MNKHEKRKSCEKIKKSTHEYYLVNFGSLTIPLKDIFVLTSRLLH